ncbi:MAG TPA: sulfite exporter TauE/SafE family protein [Gemmata sp.]
METERILLLVGTGVISFVLSYVGAAAGLILGHLRLPLLVYTLGNPIAGASTNLAVSGAGAVAGSLKHFRDGRVSGRVLLMMGLPSTIGAVIGVLFFVSVSPIWSHAVIGAMLIYSGWELVRAGRKEEKASAAPEPPGRWVAVWEVCIGLVLGAIAAITGLMLGTIRLPMMIKWLRIDPAVAVGSNMVIGCITAVAAAVTAWGAGGGLHPLSVLIVGPPTILGSYLGARKTGKLSPAKLKRLVGWVVAASGVFMIALASPALFRSAPGVAPGPAEDLPDLRPEAPRPPQTEMGFMDEDPDDDDPEDE